MWRKLIRPALFLFDGETAHFITLRLLKIICFFPGFPELIRKIYSVETNQKVILAGLEFKNRLGLAAGLDKNGEYISELALFGFSHIEIGTITPRPQPGNPKPRLFRLPKDFALINRMGFNNDGADKIANRLRLLSRPKDLILGINIGKNKDTALDKAWEDYLYCFETLYDHADYFTINVSSPNTPGLRGLQEKQPLLELLKKVKEANEKKLKAKPVFLKIAPDLNEDELKEIKSLAIESKVDAIIIGNTTISRENLKTDPTILKAIGNGGLSGRPLTNKAVEKMELLKNAKGKIPLVGVGGIMNEEDAIQRIFSGAELIQIYTGFIYQGPAIIKKIVKLIDSTYKVPKK